MYIFLYVSLNRLSCRLLLISILMQIGVLLSKINIFLLNVIICYLQFSQKILLIILNIVYLSSPVIIFISVQL